MLKLSREADYGIVLMTRLAQLGPNALVSARDLADDAQVSHQMVSKILKQLTRGGLLTSQRGVRGGYRLAHAPDAVSVADVITAIEGPIALTECADTTHGDCERESVCDVRANWRLINRRVMDSLGTISLSEMAEPLKGLTASEPIRFPMTRRHPNGPLAETATTSQTEARQVGEK